MITIVCHGDSLTEGADLNPNYTWPLHMKNIRQQEMMAPIGGWENCARKLERLVEALATAARESDIACLDFYHLFVNNKGGVQEKFFLEDGLHPNKDGHLLMAVTAAEFLKSTFYLA